jgi:two-component system chemotaxis response regulator CheB
VVTIGRPEGEEPARRDIVVIGASAGGVNALLALCGMLPPDFPAAVLVVLHVGQNPSVLPMLLASRGHNHARHGEDGLEIETGTIYVAPPDRHMLVEDGRIVLTKGPKEHHTRPAVDPLFRSAALAYGRRVVGVVLTGRLDDGTSGLQAIKDCGGLAIVQDPADAEYPAMPRNAMQSVEIDRCVPLASLPRTLMQVLEEPITRAPATKFAERLNREMAVSEGKGNPIDNLNALGRPSSYSCPDCDGVLWEIEDVQPARYRCHTGHAFSLRSLAEAQSGATEDAIWGAIRALQIHEEALRRLAAQNRHVGDEAEAAREDAKAEEASSHAQVLLQMLQG